MTDAADIIGKSHDISPVATPAIIAPTTTLGTTTQLRRSKRARVPTRFFVQEEGEDNQQFTPKKTHATSKDQGKSIAKGCIESIVGACKQVDVDNIVINGSPCRTNEKKSYGQDAAEETVEGRDAISNDMSGISNVERGCNANNGKKEHAICKQKKRKIVCKNESIVIPQKNSRKTKAKGEGGNCKGKSETQPKDSNDDDGANSTAHAKAKRKKANSDGKTTETLKQAHSSNVPKQQKKLKGSSRNDMIKMLTEDNTDLENVDVRQFMRNAITERMTPNMCSRRWNDILTIRNNRKEIHELSSTQSNWSNPNNQSYPSKESTANDDEIEAFDCSDLIVPPTATLVEREVQKAIEKWKDLDSRLITDGMEDMEHLDEDVFPRDSQDFTTQPVSENGCPKAMQQNVRKTAGRKRRSVLPTNFDYACRASSPNTHRLEDENDPNRPRVISLLDPTQTLDYEDELMKIFESVPTVAALEEAYGIDSSSLEPLTSQNRQHHQHGLQHTLEVKKYLKAYIVKYSRMDAHSLGRLRVRDRHSFHMKDLLHANQNFANTVAETGDINSACSSTGTSAATNCKQNTKAMNQTSIRFEILRHSSNLKRGSGPDSNRLEVELNGSCHTLLDLHRVLVESHSLHHGCRTNNAVPRSSNALKDTKEEFLVSGENIDVDDGVAGGVFFIEGNAYAHGHLGGKASESILEWLDGIQTAHKSGDIARDKDFIHPPRRHHLGIPTPSQKVSSYDVDQCFTPMAEAKLNDLSFRLGIRYFHVFFPSKSKALSACHDMSWTLVNESALFVTGINTHASSGEGSNLTIQSCNPSTYQYPSHSANNEQIMSTLVQPPILIHDPWVPSHRPTVCSACNFALATVVTVNDELADASSWISSTTLGAGVVDDSKKKEKNKEKCFQGTPLCANCFRELHYQLNAYQGADVETTKEELLELRPDHSSFQVYLIEDFHGMISSTTLNDVSDFSPN